MKKALKMFSGTIGSSIIVLGLSQGNLALGKPELTALGKVQLCVSFILIVAGILVIIKGFRMRKEK